MRLANKDAWQGSAESLKEVVRQAGGLGITVCVEPINRDENYLINALDQAAILVQMIPELNVKILADVFDMNVEEKNLYKALVRHKDLMGHLHDLHLS
jgi:sugar phosphate isomerase/epimerase